jgi:2-polyprenyl-6-methoxyphenol hydroxylase-like FAD-dependent oxidoreductase
MNHIGKILVVGGGIGGMAAAIRLREAGADVELIDKDPEWRVYGAGITITGPTLRAYKRLGLIDAIKAHGAITNGILIYRADGMLLRALEEPALEDGLPASGGIMRPVLHRLMQDRVNALSVPVRLGVTVERFVPEGETISVTFSDGSTGTYGLVIGADGSQSQVRSLAFPGAAGPVRTGQGCWRITTPRPPGFDKGEFYIGHRNAAGITACGPDIVYMFVLPADHGERMADKDLHEKFLPEIEGFGGNIAWMAGQITAKTWINYRPLEAMLQPPPWHAGRIVLLGDAAHATPPQLASGAGMAVEDALVLSEELASSGRSVEASLQAYTARRYERCRMVVETSVAIGRLQLAGQATERLGAMTGDALHKLAAPF